MGVIFHDITANSELGGGLTPLRLLLAAIIIAPLALWVYLFPLQEHRLPFRNLPGPKPTSGVFGNLLDLSKTPVGTRYSTLVDKWGTTLRYRGLLGRWRIVSTDTVAISYVLRHTGLFHRHPSFNALIDHISGPGVLVVEDEPHRRQRRVLNAAFNGTSVNNMMPMFWEEAYLLKDHLNKTITTEGGSEKATAARIDVLQAYIGTALDVIGRAGFNYYFNSHSSKENALAKAFNHMINANLENKMVALIQQVFPAAFNWPTPNRRAIAESRKILDDIGKGIVRDRKAEIARDHISLEKNDYEGKDVISLCLRANMLANERDKMTDDEVLGQIGTLMLAGNETSATALSWATHHFVQRPDIQARLREELLSVTEDQPTPEELNALPYLDKFVRELLRFDPPLPQVVRTAAVDCVVPLSKPVVGRDGKLITELRVPKGTDFVVPINNINRSEEVWGPDADVFNPDRYDNPAYPKINVPGVWGGLLSFIGGPHHCLGFRFALLEIKAVLFVVLRNFEFEMLPTKPQIERVAPGIVMRPIVVGEESKGIQMPVLVRRIDTEYIQAR